MAGTELAASVLIGTGLGYLADRYFHTFPYLMVVGFVLGTISGFRNAFRAVRKSQEGSEKESKKGEDP